MQGWVTLLYMGTPTPGNGFGRARKRSEPRGHRGALGYTDVTIRQDWGQEWNLLALQTPDLETGLGRLGGPRSVQHVRLLQDWSPESPNWPFLTKHSDMVEMVSLRKNHVPHLAKNWAPSLHSPHPLPTGAQSCWPQSCWTSSEPHYYSPSLS